MSEAVRADRHGPISQKLSAHYAAAFQEHGATARGVDWRDQPTSDLRYDRMLAVIDRPGEVSLLDVGCGYGGLLDRALSLGVEIRYTGIDLVESMLDHARRAHPDAVFHQLDAFEVTSLEPHDFVVCNGMLTQKLDVSLRDMDRFVTDLVTTLFSHAKRGVAFNVMTSMVNFTSPNLFYKSPTEMVAFCQTLTDRFRIDHSYPLYEYTVYLYRD
jgi:2-polyprenyl-3-methyl-5-hydroxy-6-metoxy-1,4-benzoquinol methylase